MIGVTLARGSGFEGQTETVVILVYGFWQNDLNSDPEIIGKTLKLDNVPYVVAGIAPEQFEAHHGMQGRAMFVPLERYPDLLTASNARFDRSKEWLHIHGRLRQEVSVAQASAAVAGITSQLAKE
jgi:putative ABC transport system permease protein